MQRKSNYCRLIMNVSRQIGLIIVVVFMASGLNVIAGEKKPLKVFILAGQSNAEGHVNIKTFQGMKLEPVKKDLVDVMMNEDGSSVVLDDVYISCLSGAGGWPDKPLIPKLKEGKLTVNYGAWGGRYPGIPTDPGAFKIGPEYSFGIFMHKHLKEPFLIIKTAWGGRALNSYFRPPSAGPYKWHPDTKEMLTKQGRFEEKDAEKQAQVGVMYGEMMKHIKKVLEDPGKVHPAYDPEVGYELAGFIWFQGFNDQVDGWTYKASKEGENRFDLYSVLLGDFIRDVRKELKAPKMPFLIGVIGIGGEVEGKSYPFREAMAKPASLPEFKGNVIAVDTAKCWDKKLGEVAEKIGKIKNEFKQKSKAFKRSKPKPEREALKKFEAELTAEREKKILETVGADGLEYYKANVSNGGYHYLGSARIMGSIGKVFADSLNEHLNSSRK